MLSKGEKVFIITRRLFEADLRRHFVGEVEEASGAVIQVCGYAFVFDDATKQFVRREEKRTRIFSIIDAGIMVSVMPASVQIGDLQYRWNEKNQRVLTDEKSFELNVSEFGLYR